MSAAAAKVLASFAVLPLALKFHRHKLHNNVRAKPVHIQQSELRDHCRVELLKTVDQAVALAGDLLVRADLLDVPFDDHIYHPGAETMVHSYHGCIHLQTGYISLEQDPR